MLHSFKNLSIRSKLWVLIGLLLLATFALVSFDLFDKRRAMFVEKQLATKHVVEVALSTVAIYEAEVRAGRISEAEAKTRALGVLHELRYEGKEYFWVQDMGPNMLMHPTKPELQGTSLTGFKDPNGRNHYQDMVDVVKAHGAGYVSYDFIKPGDKKEVAPKISYVAGFAPWGWIIGSGIYVDDVNAQFVRDASRTGIALVLILVIAVVCATWVVAIITRPIDEAVKAAEAIAVGRIDTLIPQGGKDETGRLLAAMSAMQSSLQRFVDAQSKMAQAHAAGDVDAVMPVEVFSGTYGEMAVSINALAEGHLDVQRRIVAVMEHYAEGDFAPDLAELPGKQAAITAAVATVKANLRSINEEICTLSNAAMRGDFTLRGNSARYKFTFAEMIDNFNALMETCHASLTDVSRVLSALACGNLTEQIHSDYSGMFGALRDDANHSVSQLRSLVSQILQAVNEIDVAAGEIAQGNADLSSRTEQQAASLEETSSSMEQLMSTVQQNADNAKLANDLTRQATEVAERGGVAVDQVIQTMEAISQSSTRISDIISVIDGIAFQTNILALNAAVEAARAGESGRGFAVVASEVRSLAQRSTAAAKEIKSIISSSSEEVGRGTVRVNEAGSVIQETVVSVRRITDIMGDIAQASAEQSAGISQSNLAIADMDRTTQQNAALVEEAAAAAKSLKDQAQQLMSAVGVFKLTAGQAHTRSAPAPLAMAG